MLLPDSAGLTDGQLLEEYLSRRDETALAVHCDLEGKTRKEAARQIGVPDGTPAAQLARGRPATQGDKCVTLAKSRHFALSQGTIM